MQQERRTAVAATHRVRLHFRSISLTDIAFEKLLANAQKVYAQYGISVEFGSGMSLALSSADAAKFEQIDGECNWTFGSGEYYDLQQLGGQVPSDEILVFYVQRFSSASLLGCGGHIPGKPACTVAAAGSQWSTAHEVGHVLLGSSFSPVHSTDTTNLMYSSTPGITAALPGLTDAQVTQIKSSVCCKRI
jgi:hypothetical protein